MELVGDLKKKALEAKTKEEAKEIIRESIEEAGMILDDEELDSVSGGGGFYRIPGKQM